MTVIFTLYDPKIEFDNNKVAYNKWRIHYDGLAKKYASKYIQTIYKKYSDLDKFSEYGFGDGLEIIGEMPPKR